jgi:hypothetical protein
MKEFKIPLKWQDDFLYILGAARIASKVSILRICSIREHMRA